MAMGLVMSWSRGALLGALTGAVLVLLALGRRVWLLLAVAALLALPLLAGMPALLPESLTERITEAVTYIGTRDVTAVEVTDANFATLERLAHWRAAWLMFERAPWLGVGTGQYTVVYPSVAGPRWRIPLGHAHNVLLNTMAEGGLLSLATYLVLMGAAVWTIWRATRGARGMARPLAGLEHPAWPDAVDRGIALGALGMLGHLLAHNLVDNLYVQEMYLLVAMILGMAVARRGRESPARESGEGEIK
jgi:O-antigen ligase